MNNAVMDLPIWNLGMAYIFVLLLLVFSKRKGIRREKLILIATARMSIQLMLMGFILMYVFDHPSWWLTTLLLVVMIAFAIYNATYSTKLAMSKELKRLMAICIISGFIFTAVIFLFIVLQVEPWFNPQYCIPISGMIIGNSMTGIALGANSLCSGIRENRIKIENSLMLGSSVMMATREIVNDAYDRAILPTMNNMLTMGIVSLPGMMTGQILSGTFPMTAIKYQIGIMLAILGCTALTVILFVSFGYKTFFTKHASLRDEEYV